MWEEFHCVGDSCGLGVRDVALVVRVVVQGWANVESPACMFCPSSAFTSSVMDGNFASWGSQGGLIVVKGAVDQGICRESGLNSGCSEEIEADICLGNEEVPTVGGELRVCPAQHCNEMVLECLNGSFSWVSAVIPWGYQLKR